MSLLEGGWCGQIDGSYGWYSYDHLSQLASSGNTDAQEALDPDFAAQQEANDRFALDLRGP